MASRSLAERAAERARTRSVINRGVNGETIGRTAARIPKDVLAAHPVLVIWQSGTNDLLHPSQGSVNRFRRVLADGVRQIREAGIDVILMDVQYFPSGRMGALRGPRRRNHRAEPLRCFSAG